MSRTTDKVLTAHLSFTRLLHLLRWTTFFITRAFSFNSHYKKRHASSHMLYSKQASQPFSFSSAVFFGRTFLAAFSWNSGTTGSITSPYTLGEVNIDVSFVCLPPFFDFLVIDCPAKSSSFSFSSCFCYCSSMMI